MTIGLSLIHSSLCTSFHCMSGLLCLDQCLAVTFCSGLEFIGAAHSRIADPTAAPASVDYRDTVRLASG